ncbi:hypothetical protein JGU66_00660 [Myxococcaceae bacterium JPH2]|nr:hypothetical protein [Myxococcaceae bacterium JPH2]
MTRLFLVLALLLVTSPTARAAPAGAPTLEAVEPSGMSLKLEPEEVRIGEPFTYTVTLTHPRDHRYELVAPQADSPFELLGQMRERQDGSASATTTFSLKMSAFELGSQKLPDLAFEVATPEGPRTFTAPGKMLQVAATLPPDADKQGSNLFDFKPPTEVPIRSWTLLFVLAGLVAAGLLAWALVRWWRNRPKRVTQAPPQPLDVRVRRSLDMLRGEDLPGRGQVKEFYFRLSEILRGYLGERYGFEALECTSSELMASLRRKSTPGLPEDALMRFISESDLVKYARAEATPDTCRGALAFGYELLDKTYVPPPPPSQTADAAGPRVQ